jgi:hypothetical protein
MPEPSDPPPIWSRTGSGGTSIPAWGHTSVDFERRIDHDRLRRYRLARTRQSLGGLEGRHAAAVRREQHPLRLGDQDRRMGAGQDVPLLPADRRRQPLCLGFRLGRRCTTSAISDWLEPDHCRAGVVGMRGTIPPEFGLMKQIRQDDRAADPRRGHGRHAGGRRLCRDGDVPRASGRRSQGRRRPADHAGRPRDQELGRDPASDAGRQHGRWRLSHDLRGAEAGRARERHRRAVEQAALRDGQRTTSRRSTRSQASGATRIRTTSPTGYFRPGDQAFFDIPPVLSGLSHLLLPDLQHRARDARAERRLCERRANGSTPRSR